MFISKVFAKFTLSLSLGNLGHAKAVCAHQYLGINENVSKKCSKGKMSELKYVGLMPVRKNETMF